MDDPAKPEVPKNAQIVEFEGQEYMLKTDSETSETTVDTMSVISETEVLENVMHSSDVVCLDLRTFL